jgi:hypothetical protein
MTRIPSRATPRKTSMLEIRLEMIVGDAVVIGPAISSSRGNRQDSIAIGMVLMNSGECLVQEARFIGSGPLGEIAVTPVKKTDRYARRTRSAGTRNNTLAK